MPHLVMVIRGYLFLLIFAKKTKTKVRMKILVFYYFNYHSGRLSQFHEYARPLTKQTLN